MLARPAAIFLIAAFRAGGCNPVTMPTPLQLGETAPVLDEGEVSFGAQGGFGGTLDLLSSNNSGGAVSGRVRVGVGNDQEIGFEGMWGTQSIGCSENCSSNSRPDLDGQFGGAKASWKVGLIPQFAVIAGAGFGTSKTGTTAGGDVGFVLSPTGFFRPYLGGRIGFAVPVTGSAKAGVDFAVPAGICLQLSDVAAIFGEIGVAGIPTATGESGVLYLSGGLTLTFGASPRKH
jgi:hypothetical protein